MVIKPMLSLFARRQKIKSWEGLLHYLTNQAILNFTSQAILNLINQVILNLINQVILNFTNQAIVKVTGG